MHGDDSSGWTGTDGKAWQGGAAEAWRLHGDCVEVFWEPARRLIYAAARDLPVRRVRARPGAGRVAGRAARLRALEPQVFALLALLVENRDRLVSRDEIFEKVWDGRVVSDAALASRVKSARQALGDDGKSQRFIRTLHGQGFRFVAAVRAVLGSATDRRGRRARRLPAGPAPAPPMRCRRSPSPRSRSCRSAWSATPAPTRAIAEALPDELIVDLARLRWLFVTARGSSFRLRAADADMGEIGRLLGVRYCLAGSVEVRGTQTRGVGRARRHARRRHRLGGALRRRARRRAPGPRRDPAAACWPRSRCGSRCTRPRSRGST